MVKKKAPTLFKLSINMTFIRRSFLHVYYLTLEFHIMTVEFDNFNICYCKGFHFFHTNFAQWFLIINQARSHQLRLLEINNATMKLVAMEQNRTDGRHLCNMTVRFSNAVAIVVQCNGVDIIVNDHPMLRLNTLLIRLLGVNGYYYNT